MFFLPLGIQEIRKLIHKRNGHQEAVTVVENIAPRMICDMLSYN